MLSLTGRFARFGTQAARGLAVWQELTDGAEVVVEDDGSDPDRARSGLRALAMRCDLLLGPYSTLLMRAAAEVAPDLSRLVWNHGGSGDDVQAMAPGHVVSVLTPTSRYAESFVRHLGGRTDRAPLWLLQGRGSFGRQVLDGAEAVAATLGLPVVRGDVDDSATPDGVWDVLTAGTFERDSALVVEALERRPRPRTVGSVAAGVREFGEVVPVSEGVFGIAQWFPGRTTAVELGPPEPVFLAARSADGVVPDYPAVQAAATAVLATQCAEIAGSVSKDALWQVARRLRTSTLFGQFAVDPVTGAQVGHQMVLVRWTGGRPKPQ